MALEDYKQWDMPRNQVPHLTIKRVNEGLKEHNIYSYKKQLSRIYKFFNHCPSPEARVLIESIKNKIKDINQFSCGCDMPENIS